MTNFRSIAFCMFCVFCGCSIGFSQPLPGGYITVTLDALPNAPVAATELRARLFAEKTVRPSDLMTIHVAGYVDGLVADRSGGTRDAIARPQEAYIELAGARADLRLGYSRTVWGRLDEVQPSDVVNPLDLARFFFEGRAEARLPVALARGRLFFGERATIEAVLVPDFRRGRFDQLDEESSPFNLERGLLPMGGEPATTFGNMQGGGRVSLTTGRVDWSASVYRGFRSFAEYELLPLDPLAPTPRLPARRTFPRYTMVAGDFETATGEWVWRGEAAVFSEGGPRSFDAGFGFDRRAGRYHISGSILLRRERGTPFTSSLVAAADRTFSRERYRTRAFAVYNIDDRAAFLRNITTMELHENVSLEGSIGWFFGEGDDIIARFADRDFLYARLRVHF